MRRYFEEDGDVTGPQPSLQGARAAVSLASRATPLALALYDVRGYALGGPLPRGGRVRRGSALPGEPSPSLASASGCRLRLGWRRGLVPHRPRARLLRGRQRRLWRRWRRRRRRAGPRAHRDPRAELLQREWRRRRLVLVHRQTRFQALSARADGGGAGGGRRRAGGRLRGAGWAWGIWRRRAEWRPRRRRRARGRGRRGWHGARHCVEQTHRE